MKTQKPLITKVQKLSEYLYTTTIPAEIRRKYKLEKGSRLLWDSKDGNTIIIKVVTENAKKSKRERNKIRA